MKILMIFPHLPPTFWSFQHVLHINSKKAAYPPLGLLTVAAMLPEQWDVRLLDMNVSDLQNEDLEWADYVMISAMWVQKESVDDVLKKCRRLNKSVIAGGPLFYYAPDEYSDRVDHLILGEAEISLPPFLEDLENNRAQKIYRSREFPDLSLSPIPRWDLINVEDYSALMIQYSRGCPFDCEFCGMTRMFGKKARVKRPEQILDELNAIYSLGWRESVVFVDDNFIGNRKRVKALLPEITAWMKARDFPFLFSTQASIDLADDDELLDNMIGAGFDAVFIGLETPNVKSLQESRKRQNIDQDMKSSIKKLQSSGLEVLGSYIVGFDSDEEDIFSRQVEFIQEPGVVIAMVNLMNALPQTRLWHRLKAEQRLEADMPEIDTYKSVNFKPLMGKEKLIDGYRTMLQTLYGSRNYYRRICNFLKNYRPEMKRHKHNPSLKSFLKSVFFVGILGNGSSQFYFWKMMIRALFIHPKAFTKAMTLMIIGHHFRKTVKSI